MAKAKKQSSKKIKPPKDDNGRGDGVTNKGSSLGTDPVITGTGGGTGQHEGGKYDPEY